MKISCFLKSCALLLFIGFSVIGTAQENPLFEEIKPLRNRVVISGLSLINPLNPAVQVGYERRVSKRYAIQGELGIIPRRSLIGYGLIGILKANDQYLYKFKGVHLRAEVKQFWKNVSSRYLRPYYALEVFHLDNTSNVNSTFVLDSNIDPVGVAYYHGDGTYDDFYTIHKRKTGVQFKIGFIEKINSRWSTEMYIGLGLAIRNTTESGRSFPGDELAFPGLHFTNLGGRRLVAQVPANIKFSYSY